MPRAQPRSGLVMMSDLRELRRQVAAVRRLHQQYRPAFEHPTDVCSHCTRGMDLVDWPCPTIQALDRALT